jgi:predicted metal-dependent HD superfamily phosphohydrolase
MLKNLTNQGAFTVTQATVSKLKTEWQGIMLKYCTETVKIKAVWQMLVEKYSEKHRSYHNLSHINYLLKEAKKIRFEDFDSIYLAIWFHDLIYDPKAGDNETQSAKLAVKELSAMNLPEAKVNKVERIILATQSHSAEGLDRDGRAFLDLDLSILGADEKTYQSYSEAIRREYSHIEDTLYRPGRKRILENFLRRETIYFTEDLRQRFEERARRNLKSEISRLSE